MQRQHQHLHDDPDFESLVDELDSDATSAISVAAAAAAAAAPPPPPPPLPPPPRQPQSDYYRAKKQEEAARLASLRAERLAARKARRLAIAKECARRRTWQASDAPPAENPEVAEELASISFSTWSGVFYAFQADRSDPISQSLEQEAQVFFSRHPPSSSLVASFVLFILKSQPPDPLLVAGMPSLRGFLSHAHEFAAVTSSVGLIFETMMGRLIDRANLVRGSGELTRDQWHILLQAARHEVYSYVSLMTQMVLSRLPLLNQLLTETSQPMKFVVWASVEESIAELLQVALPLFYRQFYASQDADIYAKCLASPRPASSQAMELDPEALSLLRRGLDFDTPSPFARVRLIVASIRALSHKQSYTVGGDEIVPLVLQAIYQLAPLHLASRVRLILDVMPKDLVQGEEAYATALLEMALEAL